ncbi:hypothetical protein Tco_0672696, partial [Tanacetum coccineum]
LEDYNIFDLSRNDEDDGAKDNINNLDTIIQFSPIPSTRIHKDHPLDQVIGDLQSATQTRKMLKNLKEHGVCLRTRIQFPNNTNLKPIPRRRNRGRAPNIVEPELRTIVEVAPMAERTMEELLRAPTEGYGEAIVLPGN